MRYILSTIVSCILLFSCQDEKQNRYEQEKSPEDSSDSLTFETEISASEKYISHQLGVEVNYPPHFEVEESRLPAETPVINIYDTTNVKSPPYAIHEDASLSYLAVLPEGFGVDAPAGKQVSYSDWKGDLSLSFEVDPDHSVVYLLENDDAWAYSLKPKNTPDAWNEYGIVFVHPRVHNFKGRCFTADNGVEKPMAECNPMGGEDEVQYSGELASENKKDLLEVLQSLELQ